LCDIDLGWIKLD